MSEPTGEAEHGVGVCYGGRHNFVAADIGDWCSICGIDEASLPPAQPAAAEDVEWLCKHAISMQEPCTRCGRGSNRASERSMRSRVFAYLDREDAAIRADERLQRIADDLLARNAALRTIVGMHWVPVEGGLCVCGHRGDDCPTVVVIADALRPSPPAAAKLVQP